MRGILVFTVLAIAVSFLVKNEYYLSTLTIGFLNAMVALGLGLLMGFAGQISLGHAAFYGLGAYFTGIVTVNYSLPMELSIPLAVVFVGAVALVVGIPTLKLKGHYLAMATLGFGLIVYIFFNEAITLTGGPSGFVGIERLRLMGYEFSSERAYYLLTLAVLLCLLIISSNLINSKIGRAFMAIHSSEPGAEAMGINVFKYKLFVFVLSAVFAALAGTLYAHYLSFVAPSSFGFVFSVKLVVMVVLGGMTSLWGGVVGALFLTILPEVLRAFEDIELLIYGAVLIVCMMFMPEGIMGVFRRWKR
ncbi:MAG: branched-chain amino acid ABC transporter permease [Nitrospirae bacterium]|nr:MAG: branched-chain amino acid ABC transporter permease [Nitrospirota bacterium]